MTLPLEKPKSFEAKQWAKAYRQLQRQATVKELEKLKCLLGEAWSIGAAHNRPSFEQVESWRKAISGSHDATEAQSAKIKAIVQSLIADVEAMRAGEQYWFGPFTDQTEDGQIYWPNLGILIDQAKEALK